MKKPTRTRGSRTGRPIMVLLDMLGRRMTLRILWELSRASPQTFRALQTSADTNPSVLNARLKDMREADLIARNDKGYLLTSHGQSLLKLLLPLHEWADTWAARKSNGAKSKTVL